MRNPKDWRDETDADIRLYLFRLHEWQSFRRPAPPSPECRMKAEDAEERAVMEGSYAT